jgi:amino acid transporter
MGGELRDPGRVLPRSIIISIGAIMVIHLALNIGVVGTLPWPAVARSSSVASLAVTHNWGGPAADVVTGASPGDRHGVGVRRAARRLAGAVPRRP